ncbi:419_t:CDS:2, partial [Ambispora leptoticha]
GQSQPSSASIDPFLKNNNNSNQVSRPSHNDETTKSANNYDEKTKKIDTSISSSSSPSTEFASRQIPLSRKNSMASNSAGGYNNNVKDSTGKTNITTTGSNNNSSANTSTVSKRTSCPPKRKSTIKDPSDEKLELEKIEWEKNIEIPPSIWEETLRLFEVVKQSKEMKNRQPHRRRNHILASILLILCRQHGLPRTFVEICNAAGVRKQEIGTYYRLMLKVFESNGLCTGVNGPSLRMVDSAKFLNLKLPDHILEASIHVYRQASSLNITTGKCPVSVGAASIWLAITTWNSTNDKNLITCEHRDVAAAAGVVNATLVGCFKNLLKYKDDLLPPEFSKEAKLRLPRKNNDAGVEELIMDVDDDDEVSGSSTGNNNNYNNVELNVDGKKDERTS